MNKKLISTLVAVGVLVALIVAYLVVDNKFSKEDEVNIDELFGTYEYLWEEKAEALSQVQFNVESGAYTIKVSDDIVMEGYESVIISRYELMQSLRNIALIKVEKFLDVEKADYAKYGFEESKNVITLNFSDGRVRTLVIGHNSGVDNEVYALSKEDSKVCTLSKETVDKILRPASSYKSKIICTLSNVFLRELTVSKGSQKLMSIKETTERDSYAMEYPYNGAVVSSRKISDFLSMFSQIDSDAVVEENPADISKYGFANGLVIYIHDSASKHTFKFGDMAPEGGMYIMYNDRPVVYRGNIFLYEYFKDVNPVEYLEPYVHLFDVEDMLSAEVSGKGKNYVLAVTENNGKNQYSLNGKTVDETAFVRMYQSIAGVYYGDVVQENGSSDVYLTITFKFKDGTKKVFNYYDTSKDYCVVKTTNGYNCTVLKSILDAVMQNMSAYSK